MPANTRRIGFCMLLVALMSLHAEEKPMGPQDLLSSLMENNPEIQAARFRFEAATKRPSQAGTLPEPKASYTNLGVGHPLSRPERERIRLSRLRHLTGVSISGKAWACFGGGEARGRCRPAELSRGCPRCDCSPEGCLLRVARGPTRRSRLTRKNGDLLSRFEEIARNRYTVGKGLQQDVLKAQLEVSTLEQQLAMLDEKRQRAEAEIASLLAMPNVAHAALLAKSNQAHFLCRSTNCSRPPTDSPRVKAEQKMVDARAVGINRSLKDFRRTSA